MWKRYKEAFDEVRASKRLRMEVMDMTEQKRMASKRRVPKAVLAAAVLVLALAGTAAAQSFGWVELQPREDLFDSGGPGYHVRGDAGFVPLEDLPQEILDRAAEVYTTWETDYYGFASWSEAEEFLGLELADNPKLEQMQKTGITYEPNDKSKDSVRASCVLVIDYSAKRLMRIEFEGSYMEDGYLFSESAILYTEDYLEEQDLDQVGYYGYTDGDTTVEEYVTPNGLAVTIVARSWQEANANYVSVGAYFLKNNAHFRITTFFDENPSNYEQRDMDGALARMKEILDAYE